jgi:uncharacterized protein (TIGR02147 family)
MRSLFEYLDYQKYLEDYIAYRKTEKDWYSYRFFAQNIGIDHGNFIKILQGKRHASKSTVDEIIRFLKFNPREAEYFRTLVEFNKSRREADTRRSFERLQLLLNFEMKEIEPKHYAFYQKWYHTAIYNLLDHYDYRGDFRALAAKLDPPISPKQAQESLQLLTQLELIEVNADGVARQTEKAITTGNQWKDLSVQMFQESTLNLALLSLRNHPKERRDFSTLTMSIGPDDLAKIKEATRAFRKSVIKIVQESPVSESVYQLNIQIFPMTRTTGGSL